MHPLHPVFLSALLISNAATICRASAEENSADGKFYRVVDGKVDARTFNGFRRYHGSCDHCHGPDGVGSTVAPPLVDRLPALRDFSSSSATAGPMEHQS